MCVLAPISIITEMASRCLDVLKEAYEEFTTTNFRKEYELARKEYYGK